MQDYEAGTKRTTYAGKLLRETELNAPGYDTTYVWSELNNAEFLSRHGLSPLIIDANPIYSPLDWGGLINDGLTRESNVTLVRHRNIVFVQLLRDGYAGMELYLEYGADYWKYIYNTLPKSTQDDLFACYGHKVIPLACQT